MSILENCFDFSARYGTGRLFRSVCGKANKREKQKIEKEVKSIKNREDDSYLVGKRYTLAKQ